MELLLLRHGKAEDSIPRGSDFDRALIEKGKQQAHNAARILRASKFLPELVISSPLKRTAQTANEFTRAANLSGPLTESWLACGMSPETALSELTAYPDFHRIMLVGHEPDLSQLIQHCLGTVGNSIEIRKGSLTCLEIQPPSPRAKLLFLMPYKLAKHLDV